MKRIAILGGGAFVPRICEVMAESWPFVCPLNFIPGPIPGPSKNLIPCFPSSSSAPLSPMPFFPRGRGIQRCASVSGICPGSIPVR